MLNKPTGMVELGHTQSFKTYKEIKYHTGVLNKLQIEIKAFGLL
jgi:hypothetical protein